MSEEQHAEVGESPPVSHPAPQPAEPARASRGRRRLPPPQVLAAAALVVVAGELFLWQVGGVGWGIAVHIALVVVAAVAALVWVWARKRFPFPKRRPGARKAAGVRGAGRAGGGLRGRVGRALGGMRSKAGRALGGRKSGGRRAGAGRKLGGKLGAAMRKAGGRSGALGRKLTGSGRKAGRSGAGRKPTGVGRKAGGLRLPGVGGRKAGAGAGRKAGRWGALAGRNRNRKPTPPEAAARRPGPTPKAEPPAGKPEKAEQEKAEATVEPTTGTENGPTATEATAEQKGHTTVADMGKITSAAEELAAAIKSYDPEDMHQLVREIPSLGAALNDIAGSFDHLANRAESEWPIAGPVAEAIKSIGADVRAAGGTAEEARGTVGKEHETDIERNEAPRKGSRAVEAKWNV